MANDDIQWSSEQMIEKASNWSLAGDVALLNSLKKFSETVLSSTQSLSSKVDTLLNNLENVSLKLELTKSEFQSLRYTQFIENRVYEDDETLETDENKSEEKEVTDEDKENAIKKAISKGLKIMEKYYDKVEVEVSDSEGEGNEKSYVLQPKDLYADRPLPYLVGSQDWCKKWHVGLLPSDSESESEEEHEAYSSSSDSEDNLPKNRILGSETSSELEFANRNTGPVANSTFNDSQDPGREMFHSSDESSEQSNSLPVNPPISNEKFAEQLAAKLGDVISGKSERPKNVTEPTGRVTQPFKYGNLFSDQPPPLDDLDATVLSKPAHQGLFSDARDLFAENNENDLFWGSQQKPSGAANERPEVPKSTASSNISKPQVFKDLFDNSDSSSEEDMLTVTEKKRIKSVAVGNPYMKPFKPTLPFIDDQPPEITPKSEVGHKKKPVGGISIFGENNNIFAGKSTNKKPETDRVSENIVETTKKTLKKSSLFSESSDEEMFISKPKKEAEKLPFAAGSKKLNLFEDFTSQSTHSSKVSDDMEKTSLFEDDVSLLLPKKEDILKISENTYQNTGPSHQGEARTDSKALAKKVSLFDDDDDFFKEQDDIFGTLPKKKNIFDDWEGNSSKAPSKGLFDDDDDDLIFSAKPKDPTSQAVNTSREQDSVKKRNKGLFEDVASSDNSDDGLFAPLDRETLSSKNVSVFNVVNDKTEVEKSSKTEEGDAKGNDPSPSEDTNENIPHLSENESIQKEIFGDTVNNDLGLNQNDQHSDVVSESAKNVSTIAHTEIHPDFSNIDKDQFEVEKKNTDDLKPDRRKVLGKIRQNLGLFDNSEGEKSSDDDMFNRNTKEKETTETSSNIRSAEDEVFLKPEAKATFKPDEIIQEARDEEKGLKQNFIIPPPISLFDPTPPPVDWDATSDNSADSDSFSLTDGILERTSYNQSQPTSSSLFDEAPPSLEVHDMNYSSGIGRDINVTRVETDDSSFYPHASSSRRLSSDIFSDQQSQDSFFVTKNPSESLAQSSSLKKISEHSDEIPSMIENLTPSGNPEDFEGSSSVFEKSENESNGDTDKTTSIMDAKKPDIVLRRPRFTDDVVQTPDVSTIKTSPGKLRHSLNINVCALVPGAAPPRSRPTLAKSASLDETDKSSDLPRKALLPPKPALRVVKPRSEMLTPQEEVTKSTEGGKFENLSETEVLQSVTKDRVKIPIKRRPSSRKARQEAVRKSMTDFSLYQNMEPDLLDEKIVELKSPEPEQVNNIKSDLNKTPHKSVGDENADFLRIRETVTPEVMGISLVFDKHAQANLKQELFNPPTESSEVTDEPEPRHDSLPQGTQSVNSQKTSLFEDNIFKSSEIVVPKSAVDTTTKSSEVLSSSVIEEEKVHTQEKGIFKGPINKDLSTNIIKNDEPKNIFEDFYEESAITRRITSASSSAMKKHERQRERSIVKSAENIVEKDEPDPAQNSSEIRQKSANIFGKESSHSSSDEELFSGASKISKKDKTYLTTKDDIIEEQFPKKSQTSGLFDEKSDSDGDGGDIFGSKSKLSTTVQTTKPPKKTSIFNDSGDSSDDELFGSKSSRSSRTGSSDVQGAVVGTRRLDISKTATVKKLENKRVTDFDPLSGFK